MPIDFKMTEVKTTETGSAAVEPAIVKAAELKVEEGEMFLVVRATGKLNKEDYPAFVAEFNQLVREHGKMRVVFDVTGLEGWDAGAIWEEIKFDVKHISDIERLAVIGDKRWHHGMTAFLDPFTPISMRYFHRGEAAEARRWVVDRMERLNRYKG